jgi:hypothetical protein
MSKNARVDYLVTSLKMIKKRAASLDPFYFSGYGCFFIKPVSFPGEGY